MKMKNILAAGLACGILGTSISGCSLFKQHEHKHPDSETKSTQSDISHQHEETAPAASTDVTEKTTASIQTEPVPNTEDKTLSDVTGNPAENQNVTHTNTHSNTSGSQTHHHNHSNKNHETSNSACQHQYVTIVRVLEI